MEITFKHILIAFFIVVIITTYSLYNIFQFMPILATCDDDFTVIAKCKCVPPSWESYGKLNPYQIKDIIINTSNISQNG